MPHHARIEAPPILITGAARSGTSLVAATIAACGAWSGKMPEPTATNPGEGMFELRAITNRVVKPYLSDAGFDPMCQDPLPDPKHLPPLPGLRDRVDAILHAEGYREESGKPWLLKDPKACLMWPAWRTAYPSARWVIVRRRKEDIVASCLRTRFMRRRTTAAEWLDWAEHHERCLAEIMDSGAQAREIWPSELVHGNFGPARKVISWLGLQWTAAAQAIADASLWHERPEQPLPTEQCGECRL